MTGLLVLPAAAQSRTPGRTALDTVVPLPAIEVVGSIRHAAGPAVGVAGAAGYTVLARDEAHAWRPRLLDDVLVGRPGATVYDDLGSPFKRTVVLRGFAASPVVGLPQGVTVLVDGIPVNEPGAGEVSFDLLPLEFTESIEVLAGTASLLGPNSLGGAVNLRTRRGDRMTRGELEVEAGSFDAFGVTASMSGSPWGASVFGGVTHERLDGWRADMGSERTAFMLSGGRYDERRGVRILAFGAHSRAETAGSLPLSVYRVRPDSNLTAGDFELLRQVNLAVSGYAPLSGGTVSARLFARTGDAERFNVNQQADPDVRGFTTAATAGGGVDYTKTLSIGAARIDLRAGGGGLASRTAIELHAERIDPGLTTDVESPMARLDAYGVVTGTAGRLALTAGARADVVRVPFRNRLDSTRDTTSTFVHVSPRLSASVQLATGTVAYVSAAGSFRPPALIEIACADPEEPCPLPFALGDDPPIDPVRVMTWEAGATWTRASMSARITAYRSDVRDDIFLIPYREESEPEGSTIDGYFDNVPRTRREGVETSVVWQSPAGHRVSATHAYTRATFRSDDIEIFSIREIAGEENEVRRGSRFPLVPTHTFSAEASLAMGRGVEAGARVHAVGERFLRGDEANDEPPLPGFATVDVRAAGAYGAWRLEALVRNVLDEDYLAFGTFNINQGGGDVLERFVTPGQPRTFEIALHRSF